MLWGVGDGGTDHHFSFFFFRILERGMDSRWLVVLSFLVFREKMEFFFRILERGMDSRWLVVLSFLVFREKMESVSGEVVERRSQNLIRSIEIRKLFPFWVGLKWRRVLRMPSHLSTCTFFFRFWRTVLNK